MTNKPEKHILLVETVFHLTDLIKTEVSAVFSYFSNITAAILEVPWSVSCHMLLFHETDYFIVGLLFNNCFIDLYFLFPSEGLNEICPSVYRGAMKLLSLQKLCHSEYYKLLYYIYYILYCIHTILYYYISYSILYYTMSF